MKEQNRQKMTEAEWVQGQDYPQSGDRAHVRCPYYKRSDGSRRISCEGPIPDTTAVSFFRRGEDYRKQMALFCRDGYKTCEIYRATFDSREG